MMVNGQAPPRRSGDDSALRFRRPWEKDFSKESNERTEARTLYRFQGEFARRYGPRKRGRTWEFDRNDEEYSEGLHEYFLSLDRGMKRRAEP